MLQRADSKNEDDLVTFEEFCELVPDGQKADLIDGEIIMASPDTLDANDLNMFLVTLLRNYDSVKQLGGRVLASRYAVRVDEHNAPEPDVVYVSAARRHLAEQVGMRGGPDVAIEIVSRGSRQRDTVRKRELYEQAGVQEYWIIDPRRTQAMFLRLVDGVYQEVPLTEGRFHSAVIPGFWLDVAWLFQNPLPNDYAILQTVLDSNQA